MSRTRTSLSKARVGSRRTTACDRKLAAICVARSGMSGLPGMSCRVKPCGLTKKDSSWTRKRRACRACVFRSGSASTLQITNALLSSEACFSARLQSANTKTAFSRLNARCEGGQALQAYVFASRAEFYLQTVQSRSEKKLS